MMNSQTQKKVLFAIIFSIIGFILLQIKFTKLAGSGVSFTLFDFFAPTAGAFLGPIFGILSVLAVNLSNLFLSKSPLETGSIIRLFPTLFAVYYFTLSVKDKKNKFILLVPVLSIILFISHPVGRTVWYYTLFWLIPVGAFFKPDNLFLRSLGATFTAHAVGGAAWIWAFNLPAQVWNNLIPIVIAERFAFACGISSSFIILNNCLQRLIAMKFIPSIFKIDKRYIYFS